MNEGWFLSAVVCWKSFRCVAIFKDKFCRAESLPPYVYLQTIFFSCRLKLVWNVVRLQLILLAAFLLTSLYPYILLQKRVFLKDCCPRGCLQHVFVWPISVPVYFGCINCRVGSQSWAPKFRCQGVNSLCSHYSLQRPGQWTWRTVQLTEHRYGLGWAEYTIDFSGNISS